MKKYKLVLGSASPRRKELLSTLAVDFSIETADLDEVSHFTLPKDVAKDLALQKAVEVFKHCSINSFVVGSDTVVAIGNDILGKPKDRAEAKEMLLKLSGKEHDVLTGVAFKSDDIEYSFVVETKVTFCELEEQVLERYLDSGDSLDKAGAYGIQGDAGTFVKTMQGSYASVVGLPVADLVEHLKICLDQKNWRACFE